MNHALAHRSAPGSTCGLQHLEEGARPVWAVLAAAAEAQVSGRITLVLPVPIEVHLLRGEVYLAERGTDPDLGQRLIDLGVLDSDQLARGTVRVGATTNIGRLFDRVPELDLHQFELALELLSESALAPVNDEIVERVDVVHRAHHPSGIVRWFAARATPVAAGAAPVPAPVPSTPRRVEPVIEPVIEHVVEPVIEHVVEHVVEPVIEPVVEPVVEPVTPAIAPVGGWIADPEPVWLRSLEPVAQTDDPTMTDAGGGDPLLPGLVLAGRPSIPAPPAAPLHDLMADLDLSSILAKIASPDGPPLTPSWQSGTVAPPATTIAPAETDIHLAVDLALAGIEAATRRDEVVEHYVNRQPVPMAPAEPAPTFGVPTLPMGTPTLPIAPQRTAPPAPLPPVNLPPAPAPAPAPAPWTGAPAFAAPSSNDSIPTAPPVPEDEPARSGGFRRLIGGGNR